jgi:hypothetical protein
MAAAIAMLSYQVINQHHYVVDAFLWRVDNREHHRGLGLGLQRSRSWRIRLPIWNWWGEENFEKSLFSQSIDI